MRTIIPLPSLLALTLCASLPWISPKAEAAERQPNIVVFFADDLGYGDVQSYGSKEIKTPVMDGLAAEGARFTDAYAASNVCSPSRAALMTGRYVQRLGPTYEDYFHKGSPGLDPERHLTIAAMLQKAGYATGIFGKWNVSHQGNVPANKFGFDRWVGVHVNIDHFTHKQVQDNALGMFVDGKPDGSFHGTWSDTVFANEAIDFIKKNKDRPFFLYIPWEAPHSPIQDPDIPFDTSKKIFAENRPQLIKMVERLDLETGRVLAALKENGLSENTLVIFTSDNGGEPNIARNTPLRGAKQSLYEGGIRVPLMVRWPGRVTPGEVVTTPVSALDLTATIAAAAGVSPPPDASFDGLSLLPIFSGTGEISADRPFFFRRRTVNPSKGYISIRQSAVRVGDMKYIRSYKPSTGDAYTGKFTDEFKEELFNLKEDIAESKNLKASAPEQLAKLSDILSAWEKEMDNSVN